MEEQNRTNDEIEIDLVEILHLLLSKIWIIIGSFLIGAVILAGVTKLAITPQYSASSMIYILSKSTSITTLADIQVGAQLTVDFQTLAVSRPVVEAVIEEENLDIEYEELLNKLTVSNPESSQILKLAVEDTDPELAKDISNTWARTTAERVADVMVTDKPNIVENAVVPKEPSSPSLLKNTAIGALLALLLAVAIIVVRYLLDDTIKTEEDVKKYLNLNTLSAIPVQGAARDKKHSKSKKTVKKALNKSGKSR